MIKSEPAQKKVKLIKNMKTGFLLNYVVELVSWLNLQGQIYPLTNIYEKIATREKRRSNWLDKSKNFSLPLSFKMKLSAE